MYMHVNRANYAESTVEPEWLQRFERRMNMWNGRAYPEPLSALWVESAKGSYRVIRPKNVLNTRIETSVQFRLHDYAVPTAKKIIKTGHNIQRTGGFYHPANVKRWQRWAGNARQLDRLTSYWEPWLREVQESLCDMFKTYERKTIDNIDRIRSDPELAVGSKPEDTGTGWRYPIDTRGNLRDNIHRVGGLAEDIAEWYKDLRAAVRAWPHEGTVIFAPERFNGIFGGSRSDVDVDTFTLSNGGGSARLTGTTREVSNEPSSAFHNNTLNDKHDRKGLWERYGTASQIMPWKLDDLLRIKSTPHVTTGVHSDELAVLSFDFGWMENTGTWSGNTLQVPSTEGLKYGADQVSLWGIWTQVARGGHLSFYPSGAPWTATAYLPIIGIPLDSMIAEHQLKVKYYQIGDDVHAIGPTDDLKQLYQMAPDFMRIKGMTAKENFVLGEFSRWESHDDFHAIQDPRVFKTVSSAQKAQYLPSEMGSQFAFPRDYHEPERHKEASEAAKIIWDEFDKMIYWRGAPDDYRTEMAEIYSGAKTRLLEAGQSEWLRHVFDVTEDYEQEEF